MNYIFLGNYFSFFSVWWIFKDIQVEMLNPEQNLNVHNLCQLIESSA